MSQLKCGTIRRVPADHSMRKERGIHFFGEVTLGIRLNGDLTFVQAEQRDGASADAPDFDVVYKPRGGHARAAGAAWIKSGPRVGDFLSISMDDPDWASPLNLTAFPPDSGDMWRIVWSRPRGARVQDEQETA